MRIEERARFKMAETSKIECRRKGAVFSIINALNESTEKIISANCESSEEEKELCRARFQEIYKSAIQQNVFINSKEWTEIENADLSTESFDVEEKHYLNNYLDSKLNGAVISLSRKRKFHPHLCEEEMFKAVNKKAFYSAKVEVVQKKTQTQTIYDGPMLTGEPNLKDRLEDSSTQMHSLNKTATMAVERAKRLQSAVSILNHPTETDKVIFMDNLRNNCKLNSLLKARTITSER